MNTGYSTELCQWYERDVAKGMVFENMYEWYQWNFEAEHVTTCDSIVDSYKNGDWVPESSQDLWYFLPACRSGASTPRKV
jgi:hypothetical protein